MSLGIKVKFADKGMTSNFLCDKIFMVSKEVNRNFLASFYMKE